MLALILSGGIGKRLKPITDTVPKPLIPINHVPIIEWQIRYLQKFGINEFVICSGYKSEQIINYLNSKNKFGSKIYYSIEKTPLGTAGAIKKAKKYVKDKNFFVLNGDVITNLNLKKLKSKINSIVAIPLKSTYGRMELSGEKVIRFSEKSHIPNHWMNAGLYYLSQDVFRLLPKKGDIEKTTFPKLAKIGLLHSIKFNNVFWHSIDSHKDIEDCAKYMKTNHFADFLKKSK